MRLWRAIFLVIATANLCTAQNVLKEIIHSDSLDVKYHKVFTYPVKYHFQVIYTQIDRDSNNIPHLKKYFLYSPVKNYYYPASLVKLPLVALALEKLDSLSATKNITKDTRVFIDSAHKCQTKEWRDSTSKTGYPSIAQYIKRMLLVSDNFAYNRVYEFLSPEYINRRLHEMGYENALVTHRLGTSCDSTGNRYTNPVVFLSDDSSVIYAQPADSNFNSITNIAEHTVIGKGFKEKKVVKKPKDFRRNNYIPFKDENDILLSILFPQAVDSSKRFRLTQDDYTFLYKYMGMLPRESDYPHYNRKDYPDNLKKYIYFGTTDTITDSTIRSLNIVGRAYGFLADCSYVIDLKTNTEFCLSVLMYLNEKNILNDGKYEYGTIGWPFMSDMGKAVLEYERKRKRKRQPDLSRFRNLWNGTR